MAGPIISHNELFGFEEYKSGMKTLETLTKEFGTTVDQTIRNINANIKDMKSFFADTATVLKATNLSTVGAKEALQHYNEEIEQTRAENDKLKNSGEGMKVMLDATKATVKELKSEYAKLKKEYESLSPAQTDYSNKVKEIDTRVKAVLPGIKNYERALRDQKKGVDLINDSYEEWSHRLTLMRAELVKMPGAFDAATGKLNKNNKEAVALSNNIEHLDKVLKTADATMGRFGRNVGNYASGFSPLSNAINQLTREAPSAAISMQTFFLAISNNIPALTDAVAGIKATNKELVAAGEKPKSVIGSITTAFFSLQTAISLGITLLTLYGSKLVGLIGNLFSGKNAVDELKESQKALNEAMASTEYKSAVTQLQELKNNVELAKEGLIDKKDVVDQYNSSLGNTIGQVETLDEVEKNIASKGDAYLQFTLKKAVAQAFLKKAIEESVDAEIDAEKRGRIIGNLRESGDKGLDEFFKRGLENEKKAAEKNAKDRVDIYKNLAEKVNKEAAQIAKDNNFDFFGDAGKDKKDATKAAKDAESAAAKALKKLKDFIKSQQEEIDKGAKLRISIEEGMHLRGVTSEFGYQSKKLEIIRASIAEQIKLEESLGKNKDKAKITELLTAQQNAENSMTEFMSKQQADRSKFAKQSIKDVLDAREEAAKKEEEIDARTTKFAKIEAQIQEDNYNRAIEAENRRWELLKAGREASYQDELEHLEKMKRIRIQYSKDASNEELEIEKEKAEKSKSINQALMELTLQSLNAGLQITRDQFAADSERRINALNQQKEYELKLAGNNAAAKEKIEKEYSKRLSAEKRRQAKAEKSFALFQIALDTAKAVVANLKTPFLIPFVIAAGAIQAAVVASKPIPEYFKGTKSAKKGWAKVGEKGSELIERAGRLFVTPDTTTFIEMKGGEKVYTHQESTKIIERAMKSKDTNEILDSNNTSGRLAAQIRKSKTQEEINIMAKAMQSGGGISEQAMKRVMDSTLAKQPIHQTIMDERGMRKREIQLNESKTYLNSRYSHN